MLFFWKKQCCSFSLPTTLSGICQGKRGGKHLMVGNFWGTKRLASLSFQKIGL